MPSPTKPNYENPWSFITTDKPRWWKKRQQLQPLFEQLLAENKLHSAEMTLWQHGVSSRHIAEFFCLVARYGKDEVIEHHFRS